MPAVAADREGLCELATRTSAADHAFSAAQCVDEHREDEQGSLLCGRAARRRLRPMR